MARKRTASANKHALSSGYTLRHAVDAAQAMAALDLNDGPPFTCPTCKTPGFPTLEALGDHAAQCIPREPVDPRWKQGARVKVVGLKSAKQHNGKLGTLGEPSEGRWAVALDGSGRKLAVKRGNLQLVEEVQREPKTLERHHQLLAEFDGSRDPDTLALYYHTRDRAFDAYNASEYTAQLLRYYQHGLRVVCVSPRRIRGNDYALVQLRHDDDERNSLCELAFQCQRSFCGVSILVKQRCFTCGRPGAPACVCACAFFCSERCSAEASDAHQDLCQRIRAFPCTVEEEVLTIF